MMEPDGMMNMQNGEAMKMRRKAKRKEARMAKGTWDSWGNERAKGRAKEVRHATTAEEQATLQESVGRREKVKARGRKREEKERKRKEEETELWRREQEQRNKEKKDHAAKDGMRDNFVKAP